MKPTNLLHLVPIALSMTLTGAFAQSGTSPVIGFIKTTTVAGSDNYRSVPFERPPAFGGTVASVDVGTSTVTLNGAAFTVAPTKALLYEGFHNGLQADNPTPDMANLQPNTYYLQFKNNAKEGAFYQITDHTVDSVTVDLCGDTLAGVAAGDQVKITPYWTLQTLFPDGEGIIAGVLGGAAGTQILFANTTGPGINLSPNQTFEYIGAPLSLWLLFGTAPPSPGFHWGDHAVQPDGFMILREPPSMSNEITFSGRVPNDPLRICLFTRADGPQDNYVALPRPAGKNALPAPSTLDGVSLDESDLVTSGGFKPTTLGTDDGDELLVYKDGPGINRSPATTYRFIAPPINQWLEFGTNAPSGDVVVFEPTNSVVIRKAPKAGGTTDFWTNQKDFD